MVIYGWFLQELMSDMKKYKNKSKSFLGEAGKEEKRCEMLTEWFAQEELIVHNKGEVLTFVV